GRNGTHGGSLPLGAAPTGGFTSGTPRSWLVTSCDDHYRGDTTVRGQRNWGAVAAAKWVAEQFTGQSWLVWLPAPAAPAAFAQQPGRASRSSASTMTTSRAHLNCGSLGRRLMTDAHQQVPPTFIHWQAPQEALNSA